MPRRATALEQVQKVNRVRQRLEIKLPLLMRSDRLTWPVRTQFAASHWPTLVLVDENARIIWRGEGLEGRTAGKCFSFLSFLVTRRGCRL
jgi:hypothetical protein